MRERETETAADALVELCDAYGIALNQQVGTLVAACQDAVLEDDDDDLEVDDDDDLEDDED